MTILLIIFMVATLSVLIAGLVVMVRGGNVDKKWANRLMTYRIWFQAISIGLVLLILYTHSK